MVTMLDIATRYEPSVRTKGRTLAVTGLALSAAGLALALLPSYERAALTLGGVGLLTSAVALIGALGGRRTGRNLAAAGALLGLLSTVAVLVVGATYAPGPPAREDAVIPSAIAPERSDLGVWLGRYGTKGPGVTVKVTNKALERRSVDLTIEAVNAKGRRIATDTVSASRIEPGTTSSVRAFAAEPADLAKKLKGATFRLIETATYVS